MMSFFVQAKTSKGAWRSSHCFFATNAEAEAYALFAFPGRVADGSYRIARSDFYPNVRMKDGRLTDPKGRVVAA